MKKHAEIKKLFLIITLAFLLVLPSSFSFKQASAQIPTPDIIGDGDIDIGTILEEDLLGNDDSVDQAGENQEDPVAERQAKDDEQTKLEAERLRKAQEEEDIKVCKKEEESVNTEVGGTGAGGSQPRQDDAYDPDKPPVDSDGDGIPDPPPPACSGENGNGPAYTVANEGFSSTPYNDRGRRTVGYGHQITGNEPFPVADGVTREQATQLFDADYATARTNAQASAESHGVNWDNLTPERQTVLTDMSFNMGASGGQGVDGFDDMYSNMRDAQRTGDQASWDAAGDEIMNSEYSGQVGRRADRNADIMRNSDSSVIDGRIAEDADAQALCGPVAFHWQKPFSLFAILFKANNAFAQTYVPVQEQNGPLMDKTETIKKQTKNIETYTEQTKNLSIQICTHLRAIKRIQQIFEKKMVEDGIVSRIKSAEIAKYAEAEYGENGAIKKGGARLNINGEEVKDTTLYVENNEALWKEQSREAEKVIYATLASSSNPNMAVIMENLKNDNSVSMESDLTPEEIETVSGTVPIASNNSVIKKGGETLLSNRIPIISTILSYINKPIAFLTGRNVFAVGESPDQSDLVKSDEFWNSFKKLAEPKNNRFGSYLIAADKVEISKNLAVQSARDEALQGQGFLGTRTCVIKTPDGKECAEWKIIQPGSIVKEVHGATVNSRLDQYIGARTSADVAPDNGPDITEVLTNKPSTRGGGAIGPGMTPLGEIANVADQLRSDPNTNNNSGDSSGDGGDAGDFGQGGEGWGNLTGLVEGLFSGDGDADPESNDAIQLILGALGDLLDSMKPWVVFKSKDMGDNISRVYWYSPNAENCLANNQWLEGDGVTVIKEVGASLENSGSIDIRVGTGQKPLYKIRCNNSNGGSTRELRVKNN